MHWSEEDKEKAFYIYLRLAEAGNEVAQFAIGMAYDQ